MSRATSLADLYRASVQEYTKTPAEGMQGEVDFAREHGIRTYFVSYPILKEYYPVSTDEVPLLNGQDCREGSREENYMDRLVVLRLESLKPEYRNARNQLWIVTHGPGCEGKGGNFSDTVHLYHPIDKDHMAVSRQELLGIPREETVEMLKNAYPEFASGIDGYGQEEEEELCR